MYVSLVQSSTFTVAYFCAAVSDPRGRRLQPYSARLIQPHAAHGVAHSAALPADRRSEEVGGFPQVQECSGRIIGHYRTRYVII